jgi:hypothetical protein
MIEAPARRMGALFLTGNDCYLTAGGAMAGALLLSFSAARRTGTLAQS